MTSILCQQNSNKFVVNKKSPILLTTMKPMEQPSKNKKKALNVGTLRKTMISSL